MGVTEDRNTQQIYFCFLCAGPGTQQWLAGNRICSGCRRFINFWAHLPRRVGATRKDHLEKSQAVKEYSELRALFLETHPWCEVAWKLRGELVKSTHVHHRKYRQEFLLDVTTFVATTLEGDRWIHANPEQARQLGLLE